MSAPTLNAANTMIGTANAAGIYIAPVGTIGPVDVATAWPAGWQTLGYVHEDGITFSFEKESEALKAWQSKAPLRTVITSRELSVEFTMLELTPLAMGVFFDEAPPTAAAGAYTLDVTAEGAAQEYAVGIDAKDGDAVIRYIFPRATVSENGEVSLTSAEFQGLPVTLTAQDQNGILATVIRGSASVAGLGAQSAAPNPAKAESEAKPAPAKKGE